MKIAICIILALSAITASNAIAQAAPLLTYGDVVSEARRYDGLEGGERVVSNKVFQKMARLDLKPFGKGSQDFYVKRSDMVGFICQKSEPGFNGGAVVAQIVKHEEAEGGHFYTLNYCAKNN